MSAAPTSGVPGAPQTPQVTASGAPANIDQWISDFAMSAAGSMANGTLNAGEGTFFTNAFMDQFGLDIRFDPTDFGAGRTVSIKTQQQLIQLGAFIAKNWDRIAQSSFAGQLSAYPSPVGLPPGQQPVSDVDKDIAANKAALDTQIAATAAENAADRALDRETAAATIKSNETIARETRESIEREGKATRLSEEKIAREDREQSERESVRQWGELGRQFDLQLEEDRRTFNVEMLDKLFERGIELAKAPVDWLGYQYYLENMSIPVNALTMSSAAALMGAIPPTGPSEAGPMVGGPAVIDGDMALAQQAGAQNPGPMPVDMAVQSNPGGQSGFVNANGLTATDTVNNFGGMETVRAAWEKAVAGAQDRFKNTVGGMGDYFKRAWDSFGANPAKNPFEIPSDVNEMLQRQMQQQQAAGAPPPGAFSPEAQQQQMQQSQTIPGVAGGAGLPPLPGQETQTDFAQGAPDATAASLGTGWTGQVQPQPGGNPTGIAQQDVNGNWAAAPPPTPGALEQTMGGGPSAPSTGGPYTGNEAQAGVNLLGQPLPPIPGVTQPAPAPAPPGGAAPGAAEANMNAGQPQAQTASQPQQGALNPNIEAALQALAQQLGMTVEQVRAMFPVELLSQTQAPGGVQNAPIIQSLRNQARPGVFNTGPRTGSPFTQLRGFGGVETGVRGGQDVNAGHYLGSLQPTQEMMNGVFQAQGLSVPGTLEQMLRASPISDVEATAGRRRF